MESGPATDSTTEQTPDTPPSRAAEPETLREVKPAPSLAAGGKRVGKGRDKAPAAKKPETPLEIPEGLATKVEAVLLSASRAVTAAKIAQAVGLAPQSGEDEPEPSENADAETSNTTKGPTPARIVRAAVDSLNTIYAETGRSFRIEEVSGGFRLMILPGFAEVLEAFHGVRDKAVLTRAAIETLAIVAYKQPITRARLETIRGVACGDVLRSLTERRLVTPVGRAEELGRPILYGTTRRFLETFGLKNLNDLPAVEDMRSREAAVGAL